MTYSFKFALIPSSAVTQCLLEVMARYRGSKGVGRKNQHRVSKREYISIKSIFTPLMAAAGLVAVAMASAPAPAQAQNVKITGLGALDGEFCNRDRGLLLEDPNGTVILYDAGRTGLDHPLLAAQDIDVVLLTSMHSDHLGTQKTM